MSACILLSIDCVNVCISRYFIRLKIHTDDALYDSIANNLSISRMFIYAVLRERDACTNHQRIVKKKTFCALILHGVTLKYPSYKRHNFQNNAVNETTFSAALCRAVASSETASLV